MRTLLFLLVVACQTAPGGDNGTFDTTGNPTTETDPSGDTEETQVAGPVAIHPSWHWEDSAGKRITNPGEELFPTYVDDQGFAWGIDPLGRFAPTTGASHRYFETADCSGTPWVYGPGVAMQPYEFSFDPGALYFLPVGGDVASRMTAQSVDFDNGQGCRPYASAVDGLTKLSNLTRSTTIREPILRYTPPFVRVRD